MDYKFDTLSRKTAAYIAVVQPTLDKYSEQHDAFIKRASRAAGVLAHRGLIDSTKADELVAKVGADPSTVWSLVEKLAGAVAPDTVGEPSTKIAASESADPFVRAFFGNPSSSGMVD